MNRSDETIKKAMQHYDRINSVLLVLRGSDIVNKEYCDSLLFARDCMEYYFREKLGIEQPWLWSTVPRLHEW